MSEMVERVARALLKRMLPESTERFVDERWPEYAHLARSAIEAMEPFIQERIEEAVAEASSVAAHNQAVADAYG